MSSEAVQENLRVDEEKKRENEKNGNENDAKRVENGGRSGERKRKRNNRREKQLRTNPQMSKRDGYHLTLFEKHNETLFDFYQKQGIIPDAEWEDFKNILKVPLPSSFRIQRSLPERDLLLAYMNEKFLEPLKAIEIQQETTAKEDMLVHAPALIPFVPYAFQTSNSRTAVRSYPLLKDLHQFLVNETEIGNTSRQEAVSMVPPLLLDIQPHHLVLDACASPGSKTMQIIELMHEKDPNPEGLLVANDIEYSRCYLLVHQTLKRLPTANCVILNQDASMMSAMLDAFGKPELYDRILCDVICSGDGTFRKNPEMWSNWDVNKSLNLHKLQQGIAHRCLELLKVDGMMVYSTCSLNPIEDEAVVAYMLRTFKGKLELVDVSMQLPELKRSPGISNWKVLTKTLDEIPDYGSVPGDRKSTFVPSMFAPSAEEAAEMHLERSFRIIPHQQNSGGFYVAVLRKTAEFDKPLQIELPNRNGNAKKQRRRFREDPFIFLDDAGRAEICKELQDHYGVIEDKNFPIDNLLLRTSNTERKKAVYFVNDKLKQFLHANAERFRVVNAGVGVLRRVDKISPCGYRLMQDGLRIISPHITKRIIELDAEALISILQGADDQHFVPVAKLSPQDRAKFDSLACGSVLLRCKKDGFSTEICAWMGANTVTAFVSREEKIHNLWMLGAEATKLLKSTQTTRQSKAAGSTTQQNKIKVDEYSDGDEAGVETLEEIPAEKMETTEN